MADDLRAIATKWWTPPAGIVGKLPRVTCKACSDKRCQEHKPTKCATCGAFISPRHIHLDFVGHADLTRALIEIDPEWQWEPVSFDEGGSPRITQRGNNVVLWGRLTVLGKTLLCVGTCDWSKSDCDKELIGDMLRNGAMRFGIFGALWSKTDGWQDDEGGDGGAKPSQTLGGDSSPRPPFDPTLLLKGDTLPPVAISQPDKPLAAMTMAELISFAQDNGVTVRGTKSDIVRHLEPLVRAASGAEPFFDNDAVPPQNDAFVTSNIAQTPNEKPFEPRVADPLRTMPPSARASVRRNS